MIVQWTGPSTISSSISALDVSAARANYAHRVLIWDNYFVNDYLPGYLVLGPYEGRSTSISQAALGITANPMTQPESTKIGLFTFADFTWNATAYNPTRSWNASLREFAAGNTRAVQALTTFAGANRTPGVGGNQAPTLIAAMNAFWRNGATDPNAATNLRRLLVQLRDAPAELRLRLANPAFLAETGQWLDATELWAGAAVDALDAFEAHRAGQADREATDEQQARALRERAQLMVVPNTTPPATIRVGGDLLPAFVHFALRGYGPYLTVLTRNDSSALRRVLPVHVNWQ